MIRWKQTLPFRTISCWAMIHLRLSGHVRFPVASTCHIKHCKLRNLPCQVTSRWFRFWTYHCAVFSCWEILWIIRLNWGFVLWSHLLSALMGSDCCTLHASPCWRLLAFVALSYQHSWPSKPLLQLLSVFEIDSTSETSSGCLCDAVPAPIVYPSLWYKRRRRLSGLLQVRFTVRQRASEVI